MEYYKEPVNKKPIQKKLRRLSVYAVIITVIAVGSLTLLLLLGLAYRTVLKSFEEQSLQLGEVTGENKSMSEDVRELEESNDILTASNEKLAEDVDFYSRIMDENQLRKEIIRLFEERNSTYNVLKKIYPDKLVLLDGGQFNFFDINRELTPCEYTREYFVYDEDSGEMTYAPDGETSSIKGIDVSKYNGKINWEKVASSGVKYVYIRAGVRGYVSGEIVKDDTFEENIEKAKKAGLAVGVYFFSQAIKSMTYAIPAIIIAVLRFLVTLKKKKTGIKTKTLVSIRPFLVEIFLPILLIKPAKKTIIPNLVSSEG